MNRMNTYIKENKIMTNAQMFWPIENDKEWVFEAITTKEEKLITIVGVSSLMNNGMFKLDISKNSPYTYWGPEVREEAALITCKQDEHGIYMLGYETLDLVNDNETTKQFIHFVNSLNAQTPWLHENGWPCYPFIPEGGLSWDKLGSWRFLEHLIIKLPDTIYHNSWHTKCSIEKLFVPFLDAEVDTLRVDYLETNTPMRKKTFTEVSSTDFYFGYDIIDQEDGPFNEGEFPGRIRPIRVNETWWFAWNVGPVKIRHCHNVFGKTTQQWSGPSDTSWKYGPVHDVELVDINKQF